MNMKKGKTMNKEKPHTSPYYQDYLGLEKSEDKRLEIQKKINDLNLKASEFAIPNEFDRILEGMGGTGINAFTNNDVIAYFNQFPPHQMNKWLEVNSHRFKNPVFHGDTIRAMTRITHMRESKSRPKEGIVTFEHFGFNQRDEEIAYCVRTGLMKKKDQEI